MDVNTVISQIVLALTIIGSLVAVAGLFIFVVVIAKFKHRVTVKQMTSTGKRNLYVKARDFSEAGNDYWKLAKHRGTKFNLMPLPPEEVIQTDDKGKLIVEAYYSKNGTWTFKKDTWVPDDLVTANPITPLQKNELVRQIRKIESRKKDSIHQLVRDALPYLVVLIFFVMGFAFYDDIVAPSIEMAEKSARIAEVQLEITENQAEITQDLTDLIKRNQAIDGKDIIFKEEPTITE